MLSELMATISNKFNQAIAVMTKTDLKERDITNGEPYLPKFETNDKPEESNGDESILKHKRAAAAAFGQR